MITIAMSTAVRASRKRVWRALTSPAEVTGWDASVDAALDAPADYPRPGQHVRWRARLGGVPLILHDRPVEVRGEQRLRSRIDLGLFRFDETWSLADDPTLPERTRVSLKLVVPNEVPVLGGALDRFSVRQRATRMVEESLRAVRDWCEAHPG